MHNQPIISVKHLHKHYGDFKAVNGISFDIEAGKIFGLLGPNGAGKTTTLEIIETLKAPTSGVVIVDGFDVTKNPQEVQNSIGIQLQSSGFYPNLNLIELIQMFGVVYNVPVKPREILKKFKLEDKSSAMFENLSGGQKQRFSLATTLINTPKIIFLDEPTTGLDPQARANLWEVIREINEKGVTIVMTTHYMDEAEQLCDTLAIMDKGKIIAQDTPENLIKDLLKRGFKRHTEVRAASLEDVFLNLTGKNLREVS